MESQLELIDDKLDSIEASLDKETEVLAALESLQVNMKASGFSMDMAFEADRLLPDGQILRAYCEQSSAAARYRLAEESLMAGIKDSVMKIMEHVSTMLKKAIGWLVSLLGKNGIFTGNKKQVTEVMGILGDRALLAAVEDGFDEANKVRAGMEDFALGSATTTKSIFASYQSTLSDHEIDFITSGNRYKNIRDAVGEFTRAQFAKFIRNYEFDLHEWSQEGLERSVHVGNDEDVVRAFVVKRTNSLNALQDNYMDRIRLLREMADQYVHDAGAVHRDRLKIFLNKPSGLFPHLEHLWKEIHFERISDEDQELLKSLQDIQKKHEALIVKFKASSGQEDKKWAPRDEMLKLIAKAHQNSMTIVSKLVKVAGYIKQAANTAYSATMKSFNYIVRVLNEVSKMPGVNRERVLKSLDVINARKAKMIEISKLAT